ncbi:PREDICTED: uncharacterized protein LOC106818381, partial [Priapulus caudatus]|uniref:Uncharacterized protein LOC106818381 n=1 Tax=Priapulus caudatus TaxID=37621 RepID=A0ABM1F2B1_PRICU
TNIKLALALIDVVVGLASAAPAERDADFNLGQGLDGGSNSFQFSSSSSSGGGRRGGEGGFALGGGDGGFALGGGDGGFALGGGEGGQGFQFSSSSGGAGGQGAGVGGTVVQRTVTTEEFGGGEGGNAGGFVGVGGVGGADLAPQGGQGFQFSSSSGGAGGQGVGGGRTVVQRTETRKEFGGVEGGNADGFGRAGGVIAVSGGRNIGGGSFGGNSQSFQVQSTRQQAGAGFGGQVRGAGGFGGAGGFPAQRIGLEGGATGAPEFFTTTRYGPISSGGLRGSGDRGSSLTFSRHGSATGSLFSRDTADATETAKKTRGYEYRYSLGIWTPHYTGDKSFMMYTIRTKQVRTYAKHRTTWVRTRDKSFMLYTIRTKQIKDDDSDYKFIQRQWEDLEWLEHCLTVDINVSGIIVPPLPPKPGANAASAETRSRKQLGSATKTLVGDEFYRDCRMLEKYLRLLINHPTFGKNPALEKFLMQKEPPTRARVKKGMFSKLSSAVENRKSSHPDCDEFFQKERTWVTEYSNIMKDCSNAFNQKVYAQKSLANAYGHLATASTLQSASQEGHDICLSKFLTKFSSGLEGAKHGLEVMSNNDERTLGFYLEFYAMTFEAEKDMLLRRTCLLVEYETANKTLDKAKPNKKEAPHPSTMAQLWKATDWINAGALTPVNTHNLACCANYWIDTSRFSVSHMKSNDQHRLL